MEAALAQPGLVVCGSIAKMREVLHGEATAARAFSP
jgi:hypothetical protein